MTYQTTLDDNDDDDDDDDVKTLVRGWGPNNGQRLLVNLASKRGSSNARRSTTLLALARALRMESVLGEGVGAHCQL
eukprot:6425930-Amphidinium_carterae.1